MNILVKGIKSLSIKETDRFFAYFISATIPFTVNMGNIAIITAFIYSVFTLKYRPLNDYKKQSLIILLPLSYFFMILISAVFSDNLKTGFILVDKSLFFVLVPFLLVSFSRNIKPEKVLMAFSLSTFILTLILVFYSVYQVLATFDINKLFFHEFTKLYDQHPVYYSAFQALSVFVMTKISLPATINKYRYVIILLLLLGIFLCASKTVILIFVIVYFFQLLRLAKQKKSALIAGFFLGGTLLMFFVMPQVKQRFIEGLVFDLEFKPTDDVSKSKVFNYDEKHLISDLEIRYVFSSIALHHIVSDNKVLFGYGVGDVQDYLDLYYMQYGLAPNWYEGYNLHNQYLQVLISSGALVFLFFLAYLGYLTYCGIRTGNQLQVMYMAILLLIFFTESVLMRNKGIVLFVFFSSLFSIQNIKHENSNIRN